MPAISEMEYGYSQEGLGKYLESIKSEVIDKASNAILDTSAIENVCNSEWEGKAKENFLTNLKKDAQHVSDSLATLYSILVSEVNSVQAAMANKDEELIKVD